MMLKFELQKGSSTVGLLTATLIFVGLLVYANQYAFKVDRVKTSSSDVNQSPASAEQTPDQVASDANIDTVLPAIQDNAEKQLSKVADQSPAQESVEIKQVSSENVSPQTVVVNSPAVNEQAFQPVAFQPAYPLAANANDYFSAAQVAGLNNGHSYNTGSRAYSYSNGRGNGRGNMDGDGEFNFSMKFKSRARMDANSDFDTDMAAYHNTNQYGGYDLNGTSNPYFGYQNYRY